MMHRFISNRQLSDELIKRGLVPNECRLLDVVIEASGAVVLRFETYLTAENLQLFAEAFSVVALDLLRPQEEGDR